MSGADGDADVFGDVEELHAAGDAGELGDDVAEVDDDEQDHDDEGHAEAELFADEVAEALAGDDAHAGAHLLHDDEREGDGDHRPEERVAELGAGLGVGEDAAGVVVDVGGDEARAEDGKEEDQPGSPCAPGRHCLFPFRWVGRTRRLAMYQAKPSLHDGDGFGVIGWMRVGRARIGRDGRDAGRGFESLSTAIWMLARRCDRQERLDALNDEAYLPIVVVAVACGSRLPAAAMRWRAASSGR